MPGEADLQITPDSPKQRLEHDRNTLDYLLGVLTSAQALTTDHEKDDEWYYLGQIERMLKHRSEGGGSGSEAITRLIGLGLIDDFPKIEILKLSSDDNLPDSEVKISTGPLGQLILDTRIAFQAYLPDEQGHETYRGGSNLHLKACSAHLALTISKGGLSKTIDKYQIKYDQVRKEIKLAESGP